MTRPSALTALPIPRSYLVSHREIERLYEKLAALQQNVDRLATMLHDLDGIPAQRPKHRGLHLVHSARG